MYPEVEEVKWVKCWNCGLPIIIQVGSTRSIDSSAKCPRCKRERPIDVGSFLKPSEISTVWKKAVMKSIGFEEKDT